jgi:hypothetical protein
VVTRAEKSAIASPSSVIARSAATKQSLSWRLLRARSDHLSPWAAYLAATSQRLSSQ